MIYRKMLRKVRPYLSELGDVDQTSQILEIRALVVELPQIVVLRGISLAQRLQRIGVVSSWKQYELQKR